MNNIAIGKNIKKLRDEQNVTQQQLADKLGITFQSVSKWERGAAIPDTVMLPAIADFFGVSIDELFRNRMTVYHSIAGRLASVYDDTRGADDYALAESAYRSLFDSGDFTQYDLMDYAILQDLHSQKLVKQAEEYFNEAIQAAETGSRPIGKVSDNRDVRFVSRMELIKLLARNGRGQESIDAYQKAIAEEPDFAENYVFLATAYSHYCEQHDKGWETIEAGLKVDAKNTYLLHNGGHYLKMLGRYEEAIAYWDASYEADKEMPDNLFAKAYLYEELGKNKKAIEMWREIIAWLEQRGFEIELGFPKRELQRVMDL
ncbi:MAG: helix-turn-helix domain-containing protein [Oscillospiraceae bacterium]|nr:helix-turn-helix domain-containing protein [Oscillospiraceae bacterium]